MASTLLLMSGAISHVRHLMASCNMAALVSDRWRKLTAAPHRSARQESGPSCGKTTQSPHRQIVRHRSAGVALIMR